MTSLFVENLTVIDFSYFHKTRGLLGESWIMDVTLTGELNDIGFIFDFGKVKKTIKQTVDSHIDLKCLVACNASEITIEASDVNVTIEYTYPDGRFITLESPNSAITVIDDEDVTKENVRDLLQSLLKEILPNNIKSIDIDLREEVISSSFYHYSHGLKKHDGNCQRIAHGHRSKIEVISEEERLLDIEAAIADRFKDSYVGSRDDLKSIQQVDDIEYHHYEYETGQGFFKMIIPSSCCIVIDSESSVENIAQFIAGEAKKLTSRRPYIVRAFEGVGKGAIAKIEL